VWNRRSTALLHALALDAHPLLQFVAGDVVDVDRTFGAGIGVGAARADALDHLVVLVGHGKRGGHRAEAVDPVVDAVAFGLIGGAAALLVGIADLLQHTRSPCSQSVVPMWLVPLKSMCSR
jgi:hypothetical protein